MGRLPILLFTAISMFGADPTALELYRRTEYRQSLTLLLSGPHQDAAALQLIGQAYFMLGEYKKSTDALEKAAALDPANASLFNWLGRAYGRRAETANPLTAPGYARKSRQMLEKSVWRWILRTMNPPETFWISISTLPGFWAEA